LGTRDWQKKGGLIRKEEAGKIVCADLLDNMNNLHGRGPSCNERVRAKPEGDASKEETEGEKFKHQGYELKATQKVKPGETTLKVAPGKVG